MPATRRRADVAPQDAQRRHPGKPQQRWQRESQQQQQSHGGAVNRGHRARRRQLDRDDITEPRSEQCLRGTTNGDPGRGGCRTEHREDRGIQPDHQALARAEAAQDGTGIEVPLKIAPRGERDRGRREQHAGQRRQVEIFFSAVERRAQLRTRVAHPFEAAARHEPRLRPGSVRVDRRAVARDLQLIPHPAAALHQPRRREVG